MQKSTQGNFFFECTTPICGTNRPTLLLSSRETEEFNLTERVLSTTRLTFIQLFLHFICKVHTTHAHYSWISDELGAVFPCSADKSIFDFYSCANISYKKHAYNAVISFQNFPAGYTTRTSSLTPASVSVFFLTFVNSHTYDIQGARSNIEYTLKDVLYFGMYIINGIFFSAYVRIKQLCKLFDEHFWV